MVGAVPLCSLGGGFDLLVAVEVALAQFEGLVEYQHGLLMSALPQVNAPQPEAIVGQRTQHDTYDSTRNTHDTHDTHDTTHNAT
jgi:hypothetical protein